MSGSGADFGAIGKKVFFRVAKKRQKILKNRSKMGHGPILSLWPVGGGHSLRAEGPVLVRKNRQRSRGVVGEGSDTPRAAGPANFIDYIKISIILLILL